MKDNWILINGIYINKNYIMEINPVEKTLDTYCFEIVMTDGSYHTTSGKDEKKVRNFYTKVVQDVTGDLQECVSEI